VTRPSESRQTLPKGAFRMAADEQFGAIPRIFRSYFRVLAAKNTYYNNIFMTEWADGLEEELVLEAGCGQSTTLARREAPLKRLVGLDPLHQDLVVNPTPRWKVQSVVEALPFADGTFGGVYCDSVFEHISDPKRVVGEFYRVLKPGGRVVINTNSVFNPFMFPNKFLTVGQREWIKKRFKIQSEGTYPAPYRINTRRRMIRYLKKAGFRDIRIYRWGVPAIYKPRWVLVLLLLMELLAEIPLFCGLKHRLMATCSK